MPKPIEAEVLSLPQADRSRLVDKLISSLERDPEWEAAWSEEADRREDRIARGESSWVPGAEAICPPSCQACVTYSLSVEAEAIDFYALNVSRKVAENFLAMLEEKAGLLVEFPGLGAPTSKGRRLCLIGRYPYSILYRERDGFIYVSAAAHQSRRPKYWQARKP